MAINDAERVLVAALRSGKYMQITGALEYPRGNCCLGVACREYDRLFPGMLKIEYDRAVVPSVGRRTKFDGNDSTLPKAVQTWLQWDSPYGWLDANRGYSHSCLLSANDGGLDFDQIADIIESGAVLKDLSQGDTYG